MFYANSGGGASDAAGGKFCPAIEGRGVFCHALFLSCNRKTRGLRAVDGSQRLYLYLKTFLPDANKTKL